MTIGVNSVNGRRVVRAKDGTRPGFIRKFFYAAIMFFLCATALLLPIERGFPVIRIGGLPFTLTLLISLASFGLLFVESLGRIVWRVPKKYLLLQGLFLWVMVMAALVAPNVRSAFFVVLAYFATFVVNFLIFYYLFKQGCRNTFVRILCIVAALAALIGMVEGITRNYLSIYATWFLGFSPDSMIYAMTRDQFRVLGTLGNPIIYAVAMVLTIPFAMELRNPVIRYGVTLLLLAVSILAVTTTAVLMILILTVGYLITTKKFMQKTAMVALAGIVFVFLVAPNLVSRFGDTIFVRLIAGDPTNIDARTYLLGVAWDQFIDEPSLTTMLFGFGLKSTTGENYGSIFASGLGTIDNTYATLLIETGLLGIGVYLTLCISILVGFRRYMLRSLHWWAVLSLLAAGIAFTTIYYATFNLVWVASVATLAYYDHRRALTGTVWEAA